MSNEDGSVWIVFNGEIYNFRDLRPSLESAGHHFKSASDTEVILHLYEELGLEFVKRLNGMFAFAIWDARRKRLLLARDRFGVKPLYYTTVGDTFTFASEAKAFLSVPGFRAQPDPLALAEHFTFQNTFSDRTFFQNVHLLEAGTMLLAENGSTQIQRYWDLEFDPVENKSLQQWSAGLREQFEAAVERQLVSDVPVGSYLSGGMDTGAISAVAARSIPHLQTFTCGFALPPGATELERYFDEREESRALATLIGTTHHELELDASSMVPVLPQVVWHLDEPRVGISFQVFHTAEMIRRHVTVVLSGVGGDELFAGYPWRYEMTRESSDASFPQAYYRSWIRFFDDEEKHRLFSPELNRQIAGFSTYDSFRRVFDSAGTADRLHRELYFDFKTFLNGLLIVDDKLAMAHSVEGRVPFLDNDLIEYVRRIPSGLKFDGHSGKVVLREAMRGLLPDQTVERRKQGFTPPAQTWYKSDNLDYIRELILGRRALDRGYFNPAFLEQIIDDHVHDRRNNRFLLWSLMCFEWWNRLFVDRDPLPPPGETFNRRTFDNAGRTA